MDLILPTIIVLIITHIPAIIMFLVGKSISDRKPKATKILYILAATYTIIGLGICGTILISL